MAFTRTKTCIPSGFLTLRCIRWATQATVRRQAAHKRRPPRVELGLHDGRGVSHVQASALLPAGAMRGLLDINDHVDGCTPPCNRRSLELLREGKPLRHVFLGEEWLLVQWTEVHHVSMDVLAEWSAPAPCSEMTSSTSSLRPHTSQWPSGAGSWTSIQERGTT